MFSFIAGMTPQFLCGGSLINKDYILSAAHCISPELTQGWTPELIRLGEHQTTESPDCLDDERVNMKSSLTLT